MTASYRRAVVLTGQPGAILDRATGLLQQEKRVKSVTREPREVTATTGMSLWSWGETVVVSAVSPDPAGQVIEISSTSRLATVLIDFGRNKALVERLIQQLTVPNA